DVRLELRRSGALARADDEVPERELTALARHADATGPRANGHVAGRGDDGRQDLADRREQRRVAEGVDDESRHRLRLLLVEQLPAARRVVQEHECDAVDGLLARHAAFRFAALISFGDIETHGMASTPITRAASTRTSMPKSSMIDSRVLQRWCVSARTKPS